MGLNLGAEDVNALETRTEGWIAGLQLAALSMQGRDEAATHAFIAAFTGGHHYILEYLTEEVLRRQPEAVQRFLIETSTLNRLCGALCDALRDPDAPSAEKDGATILADLQRRNLFLVPLDDAHRWYRFHHLFADLLSNLRRRELPQARILELHRRASLWHQEHGTSEEAIAHALQAQDYERAAHLVEQAIQGALSGGSLTTLLRWLEALPEETVRARPRLRAYQGWALSLSGQPARAGQILQDARRTLRALPSHPDHMTLRGEIAAMLTGIATLREEPSTVIREGQEALAYLPAEDLASRARVHVALGTAFAYSDRPDEATRAYEQAKEMALQAGNPFLAASAMEMLAGMQIYHQGHLRKGAAILGQILSLGTGPDGTPQPFTATAHALLADVYTEWNQLDAASAYLDKGIELLRRSGIGYGVIHTYCAKARLRQAIGDADGALEALRTAERALDGWVLNHLLIHQISRQVSVRLALGDIPAAFRWATGDPAILKRVMPAELPAYLHEVQQLSLARVHLANGEIEQALSTLAPLQAPAQAAGRVAHVIEIYLLQALTLKAQGEAPAALELLERSLTLAEPQGYVRLYVDAGPRLIPLVRQAAARGSVYASDLLAASGARKDVGDSALQPAPPVLVEPLTRRELEVLRLVCAGYSNQEVAARLVISINTVKKHTGNIYGKLGVVNRAQAIVETQRLGLLPGRAPGEP
jgi:LuxR family maltose regulon positive regulatory protein